VEECRKQIHWLAAEADRRAPAPPPPRAAPVRRAPCADAAGAGRGAAGCSKPLRGCLARAPAAAARARGSRRRLSQPSGDSSRAGRGGSARGASATCYPVLYSQAAPPPAHAQLPLRLSPGSCAATSVSMRGRAAGSRPQPRHGLPPADTICLVCVGRRAQRRRAVPASPGHAGGGSRPLVGLEERPVQLSCRCWGVRRRVPLAMQEGIDRSHLDAVYVSEHAPQSLVARGVLVVYSR